MADTALDEFIRYCGLYARLRQGLTPGDELAPVMIRHVENDPPEEFLRAFHGWCAAQRLAGGPFDQLSDILCAQANDLARRYFPELFLI